MKDKPIHAMNLKNRTIFCRDNIEVLRGINSESIDLIYLDPPFGKKNTWKARNRKKIIEINRWFEGLQKRAEYKNDYRFRDKKFDQIFADVQYDDIWSKDDVKNGQYREISSRNNRLAAYLSSISDSVPSGGFYYLVFMAVRLLEMRRILKDTGSVYLHCDPFMSHYLKSMMDIIFGVDNFRNEIIWSYRRWPAKHPDFQRMHDVILRYSKSNNVTWNQLYEPLAESTQKVFGQHKQEAIFDEARHRTPGITNIKSRGAPMRDVWNIGVIAPSAKERVGYPTQKPLALLERIIEASSNPGDMVLDPFCGCATACVAAEKLGRCWVGVDINEQAFYMNYYRLSKERFFQVKGVKKTGRLTARGDLILRDDTPQRDDVNQQERATLDKEESNRQAIKQQIKKDKLKDDKLYRKNYEQIKNYLYDRQAGICAGCDVFMRVSELTIDHIIPQAKPYNGDHGIDNLQLLCWRDNLFKGDRSMEFLLHKLLEGHIISQTTFNKQTEYWQQFRMQDSRIAKMYKAKFKD